MHRHLDKVLQEIVGATFLYSTHLKSLCGSVEDVLLAAAHAERYGGTNSKALQKDAEAMALLKRMNEQGV